METRVIKLADIKPAPYNPRVQLTAKDQEYKALDASISENGLVLPLVVNLRDNCLIGGHQRLSVLLAAGETETVAVVVDMPPDCGRSRVQAWLPSISTASSRRQTSPCRTMRGTSAGRREASNAATCGTAPASRT